jgi:hypothetical protein
LFVHGSSIPGRDPRGIRKVLSPHPRLHRFTWSGQRNGAGSRDFFREEGLIREVKACRFQPRDYLGGHRSVIGFRRLPQIVVQFLRHVLQEQIGHGKTSCAVRFVGGFFSIILASRARQFKHTGSDISDNQAAGGFGDGTDGLGVGGYNLGTFLRDAATVIRHNRASDGTRRRERIPPTRAGLVSAVDADRAARGRS